MDTVVKGRHCHPSDRFREYAVGKVARLERFGLPVSRVDVELSREHAPRQASVCERVEITVIGRGPVVRGEACAADPLAALDLVLDKVEARLRKLADRRRVHHGGRRNPETLRRGATLTEVGAVEPESLVGADAAAPVALAVADRVADSTHGSGGSDRGAVAGPAPRTAAADPDVADAARADGYADGPFLVREKTHAAPPMSVEQALERMELVGHDFFLFQDSASGTASVVYRRRAYDYGVLHLDAAPAKS